MLPAGIEPAPKALTPPDTTTMLLANSGPNRTRTRRLDRAKVALSQMSYRPMVSTEGLEPPTFGFANRRSSPELRGCRQSRSRTLLNCVISTAPSTRWLTVHGAPWRNRTPYALHVKQAFFQ